MKWNLSAFGVIPVAASLVAFSMALEAAEEIDKAYGMSRVPSQVSAGSQGKSTMRSYRNPCAQADVRNCAAANL